MKDIFETVEETWTMGCILNYNKELFDFLPMIMVLWFMGIRPYSKKMHGDVFRNEMS